MPFAVGNGYPIFTDSRGKPLDEGYIHIGVAGYNPLSNPQEVFWDEALTIPATNIRTAGGYAMRDGSPGRLFTDSLYSILIQDKNGATVFYQPDGVTEEDDVDQDVVLSEAGEEYLLSSDATPGDSVQIVVKSKAADARITQPEDVAIIRGEYDRTVKGTEGYFSTRPNQSLRLTNVGESLLYVDTFDKLPDPSSPPPATVGVAWSPNSRYLAIGCTGSPYIVIYDWQSGSPVKIADPATLPTGRGNMVAWSPDGRYLAVPHFTSPALSIYDWISGAPVKIADPATLPVGNGWVSRWSPDGRYLAIGHDSAPYITIYDWISGAPVKITDPAVLPTSFTTAVAWSPDGRYLAAGYTNSPYLTIYDWQSGIPTVIADPDVLPTGVVKTGEWSSDGRYLAIGHDTAPYITIYDWESGAPVKIENPVAIPPSGAAPALISWSPDDRFLIETHTVSPYYSLYDWRTGHPVTADVTLSVAIPGDGGGTSWSPNKRYLAIAHKGGSPWILFFEVSEDVSGTWMLQHVDGPQIWQADFDNRTP